MRLIPIIFARGRIPKHVTRQLLQRQFSPPPKKNLPRTVFSFRQSHLDKSFPRQFLQGNSSTWQLPLTQLPSRFWISLVEVVEEIVGGIVPDRNCPGLNCPGGGGGVVWTVPGVGGWVGCLSMFVRVYLSGWKLSRKIVSTYINYQITCICLSFTKLRQKQEVLYSSCSWSLFPHFDNGESE